MTKPPIDPTEPPLAKVLLVEDNANEAMVLEALLQKDRRFRFEIVRLDQLSAALNYLAKNDADLIFLDLNLPDRRGMETLSALREKAPGPAVVAVVEPDEEIFGLYALQQGAGDFLVKGQFDSASLSRVVRYLLTGREGTRELTDLRQKYALVLDTISEGVCFLNRKGGIVFVNKAASDMTGYDARELAGKPEHEIWHQQKEDGAPYPASACPIQEALNGGEEKTVRGEIFSRKDKTLFHVDYRVVPIREEGRLAGALLVFQDASALKKAERDVREALEIKTRVMAVVSHELRTPLTAIKMGIDMVLDGTAGAVTEDQKDYLATAQKNVGRLEHTVTQILSARALDRAGLEEKRTRIDLNELVAAVAKKLSPAAQSKKLSISLRLADTLPPVKVSVDQMATVLEHLIGNAVKFSDEGRITITTEEKEGAAEVRIEDTGVGIRSEDLPKLFDAFDELEDMNERKTGGTGMGLLVSKKIIQQHDGNLWIKSEFGKGTLVSFFLPGATDA